LQNESMDVMNFKAQTYKGEKVLTWWEGHHTGYGQGEYVICDHSYREIKRFGAGNGYDGDHHEFLITPQETALITIYDKVKRDLSGLGGPVDGVVLDGIAQEVDIETGEVLFEWHSLQHVELEESFLKPYDYFHINSIDVYDKDHLLISSRATWTVYKVDRKTGEIIWRLGGKKSDFEMSPGSVFVYQHDARHHEGGLITIFSNGSKNRRKRSRGIMIKIDEDAMTATLVHEYIHPDKLSSPTQGNVQVLPNGNVFVGWGSAPAISEFGRDGELLFSAAFPTEGETYRAFRFPWTGQPTDDPAVAAEKGPQDRVTLFASWNGATEVATWQVSAGSDPDTLEPLASAPKKGFETVITVHTNEPYVSLQAMNNSGKVLGTTKAIQPANSD
jgi:Arylsulfotransferase (ASST)